MALIAKRLREIDFPHETFRVPDGGTSWTPSPTTGRTRDVEDTVPYDGGTRDVVDAVPYDGGIREALISFYKKRKVRAKTLDNPPLARL